MIWGAFELAGALAIAGQLWAPVLQLDGGGVDACLVEELLHLTCNVHVVVDWLCAQGWWSHLQMARGHNSPAYKPPHVEFVDGGDSFHRGHQPGLKVKQVE